MVAQSMDMIVREIPLTDIYSDPEFNIRGIISKADITDLAKSISGSGLLQPITVQPFNKTINDHFYKYRIVVGHRRYTAHEYLDFPTIKAIVRDGLSEIDAKALNFIENIGRKDLNILQEAEGIKWFVERRLTIEQTAAKLNKGKGWVQTRFALLRMPDEVKEAAAGGFISQSQIQDLSRLHNHEEMIQTVKLIKDAKYKGERRLPDIKKKKLDPTKMKRRGPEEIGAMIEYILDEFNESNIVTRVLAWCNGEISTLDLYRDLRDFANEKGIKIRIPEEALKLMNV